MLRSPSVSLLSISWDRRGTLGTMRQHLLSDKWFFPVGLRGRWKRTRAKLSTKRGTPTCGCLRMLEAVNAPGITPQHQQLSLSGYEPPEAQLPMTQVEISHERVLFHKSSSPPFQLAVWFGSISVQISILTICWKSALFRYSLFCQLNTF